MKWFYLIVCAALSACTGMPEGVTPVENFDLDRYLGQWYEVARLDHVFERGLTNVTATYSRREDGGVTVVNRGYNRDSDEWKEAGGKGVFVEDDTTGYLRVSFFGPFYGSYVIYNLDQQNYQYAVIAGPDISYLWILSRTPQLDEVTLSSLIDQAVLLGYDTSKLVIVDHSPIEGPSTAP